MVEMSKNAILKKLTRIEEMQKVMLKDWELLEDLILETSAKQLKKDIHLGRKAYHSVKTVPYRQFRAAFGLA
ncbi:hypothetical protein HZB07_07155 [Candidatus Saganbacteria bacterium]|nr:hypothetical protein [Candidatus Saganbacteria bacterium]